MVSRYYSLARKSQLHPFHWQGIGTGDPHTLDPSRGEELLTFWPKSKGRTDSDII